MKKLIVACAIVVLIIIFFKSVSLAIDKNDLIRTQVDQETGVKFGLLKNGIQHSVGKIDFVDPCTRNWKTDGYGIFNVVGEVPEKLDFSNRDTVELLMGKAKAYAFSQCKEKVHDKGVIQVYLLYQSTYFPQIKLV